MRRFAIFWSVLLIFTAAMASYVVSMRVGARYERVQALNKQMRADNEAIRMLETELTFRASPQRLQAMVDAHGLPLGLPKADQYLVAANDLAPAPGDVPQFADAAPLLLPPQQNAQVPVQLASLSADPRIVAFAEPMHVTPPKPIAQFSTPPQAETVTDAVVKKPEQAAASVTKSVREKKKPARVPEKKSAPKAEKPKPAAASKILEPVLVNKSEPVAAPRRLDMALIASIESAAAKEAQKK